VRVRDLIEIEGGLRAWAPLVLPVSSAAVLSPAGESDLLERTFPGCRVDMLTVNGWRLGSGVPPRATWPWDLVLACNVFMCAAEPLPWFDDLLPRCRWAIVKETCRGPGARTARSSPRRRAT
jgi:hypothetical protein